MLKYSIVGTGYMKLAHIAINTNTQVAAHFIQKSIYHSLRLKRLVNVSFCPCVCVGGGLVKAEKQSRGRRYSKYDASMITDYHGWSSQ